MKQLMGDTDQTLSLRCDCTEWDHMVHLQYDDSCPITMQVFVSMGNYLPWYKRLVQAMRYVVGLSTVPYAHYVDVMLTHEDVRRLDRFVCAFRTDHDNFTGAGSNSSNYQPERKHNPTQAYNAVYPTDTIE